MYEAALVLTACTALVPCIQYSGTVIIFKRCFRKKIPKNLPQYKVFGEDQVKK